MDYITSVLSVPRVDPHAPILIDADRPERRISHHDYASSIKRIAGGLRSIGVQDQECVALLSPNDIYYYVLGDGVIAAGATFCPIPNDLAPQELVAALVEAQVKRLFVASTHLGTVQDILRQEGVSSINLLNFNPPGVPDCSPDSSNPCQISDPSQLIGIRLFTSGSTGRPKAAQISHAALIARCHRGAGTLVTVPRSSKWLHVVGMYHVSGLAASHEPFAGLHTVYLSRYTDGESVLDRIASLGITVTVLAPRIMDDVIDVILSGRRSASALATLDIVLTGGAAPRNSSLGKLRTLLSPHAQVWIAYGSTETAGVAYTRSDTGWTAGYNGTLAPDADVKIIDPETSEEMPNGTDGEICCRGARLFNGYLNRAEATASSFRHAVDGKGDWFRTGDKGRLDRETGALHVTGRYKEIFKCRYEEVSPDEVEEVIKTLPGVSDVAVTSVVARDNEKDNECIAYIVRSDTSVLSPREIVDLVASRLSQHKAPTGGVIFCDSIPRTSMRKVNRGRLADVDRQAGSAMYLEMPGDFKEVERQSARMYWTKGR